MKPTVMLATAGLILLAGLAIGWQVKPMPNPTYRNVVVHDTVIQQAAPDTVLRFIDRIKWRVAEPEVIARGETADLSRLDNYCAERVVAVDSAPSPVVLPPTSGRYSKGHLELFATTSDGRLFNQTTKVNAPFEWVARGGVYEVREERAGFQFLRGVPKFALPFLAGMAVGVIVSK